MREKIYNILKLFFSLLLFFYFPNILNFIIKLFGYDIKNFSNVGLVFYQFIISFILLIMLIILYFKEIKNNLSDFKKNIRKNIGYIIKMFIIFMIVKYVVTIISYIIIILLGFDITNMTSVNQDLIETYVKKAPELMFITTAIFAPVYEEILFRLGFKKIIKNKWIFILISGSLFGLLHVFPLDDGVSLLLGIIQSISYVTMGIFLSYIYVKRENLFFSIGVHFLNNLLSILTMINMF